MLYKAFTIETRKENTGRISSARTSVLLTLLLSLSLLSLVYNGRSLRALGPDDHEQSARLLQALPPQTVLMNETSSSNSTEATLLIPQNLSVSGRSSTNSRAPLLLPQNLSMSGLSSSNSNQIVVPKDVFSACLLTMDDTHFLIEWLAYHYHTLPLRHLIVAVDPNSKTSPSAIFDRWRDQGMIIEEWSDRDFLKFTEEDIKGTKFSKNMTMHRLRQKSFYQACMRKLKADNRTWTLLIDSDEYLAFNTHTKKQNVTVEKPASVMTFLQQETAKKKKTTLQKSACIMIPRLRYGSKESAPEDVAKELPQGFNGSAFQTLRFRKHAPLSSLVYNRITKAIVDVSRVNRRKIGGNVHVPVRTCNKKLLQRQVPKSPLVIRHYLGTYEQYNFRDDARKADGLKSDKTFNRLKDLDYGDDDGIRPWLRGFVNDKGHDTAAKVLEGVGDVSQGRLIK